MARKKMNEDDMDFIKKAHGQLSAGEMALELKLELELVMEYVRQLGPAPQRKEIPNWARVRPPAIYSNSKKP